MKQTWKADNCLIYVFERTEGPVTGTVIRGEGNTGYSMELCLDEGIDHPNPCDAPTFYLPTEPGFYRCRLEAYENGDTEDYEWWWEVHDAVFLCTSMQLEHFSKESAT